MSDAHVVRDERALRSLFGQPSAAALQKEVDHLHPVYQQWIEACRYLVIATSGPRGLDISPRGDRHYSVKVLDSRTLVIPERRGNNRIDSLQNILHCSEVGLFFLIPGVGEAMRVKGTAEIVTEPTLLTSLEVEGKVPVCAIRVHVKAAFFQCSRAAVRSGLWSPDNDERGSVPKPGEMLQALTGGSFDGVSYDRDLAGRVRSSLY